MGGNFGLTSAQIGRELMIATHEVHKALDSVLPRVDAAYRAAQRAGRARAAKREADWRQQLYRAFVYAADKTPEEALDACGLSPRAFC